MKGVNMRKINIVLVAMVLLTGCSAIKLQEPMQRKPMPAPDPIVQKRPPGPLPPSTRPVYNLAGYPKAAQEGYIDGCETAKQSAYGFKDKKRFATDVQYQMGWNDGFSICRGKH